VTGLVTGAVAAALGYGVVRLLLPTGEEARPEASPWLWLAIPMALWLVILVHELGHVIAGLSQGFRFLLLAVGPLWLERSTGGLRLRFNRLLATWGGLAATVPVDLHDLDRRMARMVIGGPLASLGLAILGVPLLLAVRAEWLGPVGLWEPVALVVAVGSLGIFLVTLIPGQAGKGLRTDGRRWLDLRRGDERARAEAAMLALTAASVGGVRPRDWDRDLLERAACFGDQSTVDASAFLLLHEFHLDRGEIDEAREGLERALDLWSELPSLMHASLAVTAAYFEARHGDLATARRWLEEAKGPLVEDWQLRLAEAAVAAAEGRPDAARERVGAGLEALPRARFRASEAAHERLLELTGEGDEAGPPGARRASSSTPEAPASRPRAR
jgi:hypothetical protein